MKKTLRTMSIGIGILAAAVFFLWIRRQDGLLSAGALSALISLSLFTLTLAAALCRLASCPALSEPSYAFVRDDTARDRSTVWGLLLMFGAIVTLLQYVVVYLLARPGTDFLHSFRRLFYRSDVAHYMGIAEHWYLKTGNERLRLVFLPLYPLLSRIFSWNGNYFAGSLLTAQLFSLASLPAAYELFRLDMDRSLAMACARILFLLPGAAFGRIPMSESLFLFLTLTAVYHARRRRFLAAGLFTALAAFTRSLGVLLLGLVFLEMAFAFWETYHADRQSALRLLPRYVGALALGCTGTLAYLAINLAVSGSPFTFLTYQRENWNQKLGLFFNTASYQLEYGLIYLKNGDLKSALSLSLPNLLCAFGTLLLLFIDRKHMRLSYLIWSLVYFALSIGATWLLSGPRYLAMVFPLAIVLGRRCRTKGSDLLTEGSLLVLQTAYLLLLALDLYVY